MGIGTKMCKYKRFEHVNLINRLNGKPTIICSNPDVTEGEVEEIKKDLKLCSRRFCKHYESR